MFQFNEGNTVEINAGILKGKRGKVVRVLEPGVSYVIKVTSHTLPIAYAQSELLHRFSEEELKENAEDFKNLIPMHIRMNAEEFAWFKAKIDAEEDEHLPNLKALAKHPPKGAI